MVLRSVKRGVLVAFVLASPVGQADEELLWWVSNQEESDVVPMYEGETNPFPTNKKPYYEPIVADEPEEDVMSEEELRGAELVDLLRARLRSGEFREPNVYSLNVQGYLEGEGGPQVLVGGKWLGEKTQMNVPAREVAAFKNLVEELKDLSPELYEGILPELEGKLNVRTVFTLTIEKIASDSITLRDGDGERYVISYLSSGW